MNADPSTIFLCHADIPECLHAGSFYESLEATDASLIAVPAKCMFPIDRDHPLQSVQELQLFADTISFWGLHRPKWRPAFEFLLRQGKLFTKGCEADHILSEPSKAHQDVKLFVFCLLRYTHGNLVARLLGFGQGNVELAEIVLDHGILPNYDCCEHAAAHGSLPLVKRIVNILHQRHGNGGPRVCKHKRYKWTYWTKFDTIENEGDWVCWCFNCTKAHVQQLILKGGLQGGHLHIVQYALDQITDVCFSTALDAVECDNFACMKLVIDKMEHTTFMVHESFLCNTAAANGSLEYLTYLHSRGFPWTTETCKQAARAASLPCLQYLHEHGCPWDTDTTTALLVLADEDQFTSYRAGLMSAAQAQAQLKELRTKSLPSRLACLQYVRDHGCAWNGSELLVAAVTHADVPIVEYLFSQGVNFTHNTLTSAIMSHNLFCIEYCLEHGCPKVAVTYPQEHPDICDLLKAHAVPSLPPAGDKSAEKNPSQDATAANAQPQTIPQSALTSSNATQFLKLYAFPEPKMVSHNGSFTAQPVRRVMHASKKIKATAIKSHHNRQAKGQVQLPALAITPITTHQPVTHMQGVRGQRHRKTTSVKLAPLV